MKKLISEIRKIASQYRAWQLAIAALVLLLLLFLAIVGAVLTADLWLPVVGWALIILVAGYLAKTAIDFKKEQAKTAYEATVKATASDFIFATASRHNKDFPIQVYPPQSLEQTLRSLSVSWRGDVPIFKAKLLLKFVLSQSTPEEFYITKLYLQYSADKFCADKGLNPPPAAPNLPYLTVLSVDEVGDFLEVELVQCDKKAAADFLKSYEAQRDFRRDFDEPQGVEVLTEDDFI